MTVPERPVLVAPDSFKGTFSAPEVADALAEGLAGAGARPVRCPVADGGEGTADILRLARGGARRWADATDPLGRPVRAGYVVLDDGTAVVEVAAASGLTLVDPAERDAERASSRGTGELVAAAVDDGARAILVAAGGSATTDGGLGAIEAIAATGGLRGVPLTVLCDTDIPFEAAAPVYAPQKGADEAAVERLALRLDDLAGALPRDPRGRPHTGAAGGLAGGLWAQLGATLEPGAAHVLHSVGFDERLAAAGGVVTGEGRLDAQSAMGKVTGEVARRAVAAGVTCWAVVGSSALTGTGPFHEVLEATDRRALREAGASVGAQLAGARGPRARR
jgi:glycerate 2-kinase